MQIEDLLSLLTTGASVGIKWNGLVRERPFDNIYRITNTVLNDVGLSIRLDDGTRITLLHDLSADITSQAKVYQQICLSAKSITVIRGADMIERDDTNISIQIYH